MVSGEGLRARKQRETRAAIHDAAVRHALTQGPDAATVADISADAHVSTRTFFNYFACKEDAMLGFPDGVLSDQELGEFAASTRSADDLMGDVIALMTKVLWISPTGVLGGSRRRLLLAHPELMRRQYARATALEQRIAGVVSQRMQASGRFPDGFDTPAAASMLVLLCSSIVRFALHQAATSPTSSDDPDRLIDASLATFREVIHTLP